MSSYLILGAISLDLRLTGIANSTVYAALTVMTIFSNILYLMPEHTANINGVRDMLCNIGSTFGISVSSLLLNNCDSSDTGFTIVYFGIAASFCWANLLYSGCQADQEIESY